MFEAWRKWRYKKYEMRKATSDDFGEFDQWASGPWTPEIASKMPWDELIRGPQMGSIDEATRRVIDMEIDKRHRSNQPIYANLISALALIVAVIALIRS